MTLRTFFVLVLVFVLPLLAVSAYADTQMIGSAGTYAVLAHSTVTNTGSTILTGSLGLSPGTSITGLSNITINGANGASSPDVHIDSAGVATAAQSDALAAYNFATTQAVPGGNVLNTLNLGGMTLLPGNYSYSTGETALLTGTLTLNANGDNGAQWIFEIGRDLTIASASTVRVIGLTGAFTGGITWAVSSQATINTTARVLGTFIANTGPVVLLTGASDGCGRVISLTKAVNMDTNTISNGCLVGSGGVITPPPVNTPEPGTFALLSSGLALGFLKRRKLR